MSKSYKEYLNEINTFIFDVDGVLTDGTIHVTQDGELLRTMNIRDGYAMKAAIDKGYNICVISGGSNEGVRTRLRNLGVFDIHLGVRSEEHTSELQSRPHLVCRLLLEKKKNIKP